MNPSPALPSPYPAPGEVIDGKYQIEKVLGEGGMGMVARAYHRVLHAPVALKFMNPMFMTFPGAVERFINEGKASSLIKSDHIVPVTDAGKLENGTPFLVMECLDGMDLADLLARDGTPGLPVDRAVHFVLQVLRGLQAAHAIGIIHRDMKPSNCFVVSKDGEDDFVKILDFGISKLQKPGSASLTQTNSALGTPLYMSPEQARSPRDVDGRSDLYSVGVILYELLTGHTPFFSESGEFTEILFKLFTADPPPIKEARPDLPDDLAHVVHEALAREPGDRFASAVEMAEALAPFASERSAHIVARMRGFKARPGSTSPPPELLPTSMVAFSELDHRAPPTDVMPNRPTTDMMKGPPVTELMKDAPGKVAAPTKRLAASPVDVAARARPEEANARTQYDSFHNTEPPPRRDAPGASTDLGASRDATQPSPEPSRSPLVYALLAAAVLAIVGGGAVAAKTALGRAPAADATAATTTVPPPPSATTTTTAATTAPAEPPPSASPSASASAPAASSAPTSKPPRRPPGSSSGASGALNTQPHLE